VTESQEVYTTKLDKAIQATRNDAGTEAEREFRRWTEMILTCPARIERFTPGICNISGAFCSHENCFLLLAWRR
jgi:hypothetical protein